MSKLNFFSARDPRTMEVYWPVREFMVRTEDLRFGEWELMAEIPSRMGDGRPCQIHECRMPARFFALTIGGENPACLSTGSGDEMGKLIVQMALAVSDGMLGTRLKL